MNIVDPVHVLVPTIVVAVDDAEPIPSSADLHFAAAEARARGARIRVVHGCATRSPAGDRSGNATQERVHYGRHLLEVAADILRGLTGEDVEITTVNSMEIGTDAVLAESVAAALIVLLRRRAGWGGLRTGSTLSAVPGRAECPVVVLDASAAGTETLGDVVVAIDERGNSGALVRAAAAEALRRGVSLTAVHVWQLPLEAPASIGRVPGEAAPALAGEDLAARRLADAVVGLAATFPDVEVRSRLVRGAAADVLVEVSGRSSLLVVGRHGASSAVSSGLGRVAAALIAEARCPLMVSPVHPSAPRAAAATAALAGSLRS